MMPIVRLQGVIDAHGFELKELTAFPEELQRRTLETIEGLREREVAIKERGEWSEIDLLEYTVETLQMVDDLVYSPEDFEGLRRVEELARVPIGSDRFAIIGRSEVGIYELEEHLRAVHGDRIGLIMLEKEPGRFTVRQVDPFLRRGLEALYERLNFLDPEVSGDNRWGGSSDIGGSPRSSGSGLDVVSLARIIRWVYRPPGIGRRAAALLAAFVVALIVPAMFGGALGATMNTPQRFPVASAFLVVVVAALFALGESRFRGLFGLRRPSGWGWPIWLPVTGLAAMMGGGWALYRPSGGPVLVIAMILAATGVELLYRGVAFGLVATCFRVTDRSRGLALSVPNLVSAALSTGALFTLHGPPDWLLLRVDLLSATAAWLTSGLILALVCGMARARWHSVWAAAGLHVGGVLIASFVVPWIAH
jgi:hypothetical protein